MYIKPAAGLSVFDPVRKQFMPDEGMEVDPQDFYWARRLRDKDVVLATPPGATPTNKPAAVQAPAASNDKGGK
jgi:hypothetical protein